jgi:hypothetical protein
MLKFTEEESLKHIDTEIKKECKNLVYWGDLDLSREDLEIIRDRLVVFIERGIAFKSLFELYPFAMASYAVFLSKYKYNGDFWGMITEEVGLDKFNAPEQIQIGKMILKVFDACGLDYNVAKESGRKYVDSVLYEVGEPPESNLGDLFYIFKYGFMSNVEPQILIDEIKSKAYGVHKPLLHFLENFPEERALNFVLDIQDTYFAATQTDDFTGKYSPAYSEWVEHDKAKSVYRGKESDEHVEVRPYFYFDNGKKGLCIVLPRQNMTEEWVESAVWKISGYEDFSVERECFVQGAEGKRFTEQLIVPVSPCQGYNLIFEYNDGFETHPTPYELKGVEKEDFLYFNSNGQRINQRYLRSPFGIVVYPVDYKILSKDVARDIQSYPLLTTEYKIEQISPFGIDAQYKLQTDGEDIVLQMRPQINASLSGKKLFDSEYLESEIPLFLEIPKLHVIFEGFTTEEGIELRIGNITIPVEKLSLDEENVIDISARFEEKSYGIHSIRVYQFGKFIKQIRFCLLPNFKTKYASNLNWLGHDADLKKVVISKVDGWQIDFENGNVQDLPDKYEVLVPYRDGVLNGSIISNQDKLHLAIKFELPICAFKAELISDNDVAERCDLNDFLEGRPWLTLSFYGEYRNYTYSAELLSVNGVEQKREIKLSDNGAVNFDLNIFRDTVQTTPLPVKIKLLNNDSDESYDVLVIDEVVKFKFRPTYIQRINAFAIKEEDINGNVTVEKFGDPEFSLLLNYDESTVNERGWRIFHLSDKLLSGYYRIVRENSFDDLFAINDDFTVTMQTDQFFVSTRNKKELIGGFSDWLEQFIFDLIRYRKAKKLEDLKASESCSSRNCLQQYAGEALSDADIANLALLGNILDCKIPNTHKNIVCEIMSLVSKTILTNVDRYRIVERLVDTKADSCTFDLCQKNYCLMLLEFPQGTTKTKIKELAASIKISSIKLALLMLLNGNVPIRETIGSAAYRDIIGQDALVEMMNSDETSEMRNEDRKHFLREDGLSHVHIRLTDDISGINNFSEMIDEKRSRTGKIYLDKHKIPNVGIYFNGSRYTDLFVNWYIRNHLGDESEESGLRQTMRSVFDDFKTKVYDKLLTICRDPKIGFYLNGYNIILLKRTSNNVSGFSFPTFFYFQGLAALIVILEDNENTVEIKKAANRFMVTAFQVAPYLSERDALMASLYIYLKQKEN